MSVKDNNSERVPGIQSSFENLGNTIRQNHMFSIRFSSKIPVRKNPLEFPVQLQVGLPSNRLTI